MFVAELRMTQRHVMTPAAVSNRLIKECIPDASNENVPFVRRHMSSMLNFVRPGSRDNSLHGSMPGARGPAGFRNQVTRLIARALNRHQDSTLHGDNGLPTIEAGKVL